AVADLQHVRVVPVAGTGVLRETAVGLRLGDHARPLVGDVAGGAPEVPDRLGPGPRLVLTPFADRVRDGPAGLREGVPHRLVPLLRVDALVVAVVVLQVVDTPGGEQVRVLLFVVQRAGKTRGVAGLRAGTGVDAELQAFRVHVVGERLDAAGEPRRIGDEVARRVAGRQRPAVVDVDVGVPGVFQAFADEDVR